VENQFTPSDFRVPKVFVLQKIFFSGHLEILLLLIEKNVNRLSLAILTIISLKTAFK